ncbi:major facilitator superfamily domain-containing protein [Lophiotrema nucula]|uniref:Major facilitator superfamily domain-containing protein n=1 Tax=Lophiotrema nucula TaxID=690887 RepID=A0A6A5Z890_9PLEO|nr:major facilitator superfamily domain-containing protein [Lophiotrema nucula]
MQADEEQPLLRTTSKDLAYGVVENDRVVEGFDPEGDDENPREWTAAYKRAIVLLLACMAFTVTFTCISVVPLAGSIVKDLDNGAANPSASALLVTIWELGEAAGPLLIAPLSEVVGRYPVMNGCNMLFIVATISAAFCRSTNALIGMRALTGLAVASNVLNPAIIGDMFESDHRGSAMSLVMFAPLIGGAIGPAIGGVIAQTLGWRSVLYIAAGLAIICEILFLTCFRETYALSILKRRAKRLHLDAGKLPLEEEGAHQGLKKLWHSITRPFAVLFGSPVLMMLSLFGSVQFSYFYVMSITMSDILQDRYGFSPAMTGTSFISFSVGSFIGVSICNLTLDRIYIKLRGGNKIGRPEHRLPLAIIGAFTVPFAVILYGWAAQLVLPWPIFLTSVAILGTTLLLTMIPLSAYVVDACGLFSASAMTGVIVTRCLMGTFLPLTASPLAQRFGYGWGFTCLGAFCFVLAPIPVLIMKFGHKWRQLSEFTRDA